jgi:tetratricopeptide (TPR) repeat protein
VPLLRRLWRRADRMPQTVPEALRRAEQSRREGRYTEASALVARALELDRDNLHAHLLAAYLHVARRATAPAKAEFRWVLGHDANHARALIGLARVALEEGDTRACHDLLRRALLFYPDFPEAAALLDAVRASESVPPTRVANPAPRVDRLRLPGTGRALIVGRGDGTLLAAQPATEDAREVLEALSRVVRLAGAALQRCGLGRVHRGIIDDGNDAVFVRTDGDLIVSLTLPRTTDPTQGLLDVNRLWSATLHELEVVAASSATSIPATPVNTPAVDPTRRVS